MSYIKFNKDLLVNLEKSLDKEMLRTNRSGAYSVTSIIDCNTRKYSGLLVAPLPEIGEENYVLLSSLDETVIQYGAEFNMGIHYFGNGYYSPKGHKYIREFDIETVARTTYRVGGVVFSKERVFISGENRVCIKYTMIEAQTPATMRFRPLLGFRSVKELTQENDAVRRDYREISNGIATALYDGFPELFMQFSKKNKFEFSPAWYRGIEYSKERERGNQYREDLYTPGYFELQMKQGESVIFSAGMTEDKPTHFAKMYNDELAARTPREDFFHCLKGAASEFNYFVDGGSYIMAGYPWFKCRARDEFMSLPGLTLTTNNTHLFENVMTTAVKAIGDFMAGEENESKLQELETPDVLLWFLWAIQQYAAKTSVKEAIERYGQTVFAVVEFIRRQKHPNLFLHENGLLYTNGTDTPASWLNGVADGRPTTPRTGYLVEINALWYNALKFASQLASENAKKSEANALNYQAEIAKQSFVKMFWNGAYLYDYVVDRYSNPEVRPNMLFAASLPFSPLEREQQKAVVDIVTRELLTPKGIRSLSPKSGMYCPEYVGNDYERNWRYHNGTVWAWLMGAYTEAYLRIYKTSGISFARRCLNGFESEMGERCIGTLGELWDGNPPFRGRGAMSYAMSVAGVLRATEIIKNYEQKAGVC